MFNQEAIQLGETLRPIYSNVVLVKDEQEEKRSTGGIILKDNDAPSHFVGKVVAVGTGKLTLNGDAVPLQVKVGDVVRYRNAVVDEFKVDGHDFVGLDEAEIICVLP